MDLLDQFRDLLDEFFNPNKDSAMTTLQDDPSPSHDSVVLIGDETYGGGLIGHDKPVVCLTKGLHGPGRLAQEIATKFSLIAAMPDGEDSSGRQKMRLPTPEELAERATSIADELWKQFEKRNWFFDIPLPTPRQKKEREKV